MGLADVLEIAGITLVAFAGLLVYVPLGVFLAGVGVLLYGIALDR